MAEEKQENHVIKFLKEKVLVSVLSAFALMLLGGIYTYGTTYVQMPDEIQMLKVQHRMDSTKIAWLDSVVRVQTGYVADQWYIFKTYAKELGLEEPQTVINNR